MKSKSLGGKNMSDKKFSSDIDFLNDLFGVSKTNSQGMRTDIWETNDFIVFTCELPGFKKDEIRIVLENGNLTISAEHKEKIKEKKDGYFYKERFTGINKRTFSIGSECYSDKEHTKATFEDGLLTIKIEKKKPSEESNTIRII